MVDDLNAMVGRTILLGVTYCHSDGTLDRREQLVGTVEEVDPFVAVRVGGREDRLLLPPSPESYEPATPGRSYRLKLSGAVVDPDYLSTWTVYPTGDDG